MKNFSLAVLFSLTCSVAVGDAFAGAKDQDMLSLTPAQMAYLERDPIAARKDPKIKAQLDRIFASSIVDNSACRAGAMPVYTTYKGAKASRVTNWNEECSLNVAPRIVGVLQSEAKFRADIKSGKVTAKALEQREKLKNSNIMLMEEMRVGAFQTRTKNAPRDIARTLGMNYAFFPSQVSLSVNGPDVPNGPIDPKNPLKYDGHIGMALLTRFEIGKTKNVQLKTPTYDWVEGELTKVSSLEAIKRKVSKSILGINQHREVQVGNAGYSITELRVPGQKKVEMTVVGVHLEVRITPEARQKEMDEVKAAIKKIKGPVILLGDLNSTHMDVSPTSWKREAIRAAKDPETAVSVACTALAPTGVSTLHSFLKSLHIFRNPQALNIPLILPNKQAAFFKGLKTFEFEDGGKFDFRNNREHQAGTPFPTFRKLAGNANQIAPFFGFEDTYRVPSKSAFIRNATAERLDWMFAKVGTDKRQFKGALVQGEVFKDFNRKGKEDNTLSDHDPISALYLYDEPEVTVTPNANERKGVLTPWNRR